MAAHTYEESKGIAWRTIVILGIITVIEVLNHMRETGQPLSELVFVEVLPKSKGGYRLIAKPGVRRTAQHFILRDVLTAQGVDNRWDYARPGAGGEKAMIRDVCQRIEDGYRDWQGSRYAR